MERKKNNNTTVHEAWSCVSCDLTMGAIAKTGSSSCFYYLP